MDIYNTMHKYFIVKIIVVRFFPWVFFFSDHVAMSLEAYLVRITTDDNLASVNSTNEGEMKSDC